MATRRRSVFDDDFQFDPAEAAASHMREVLEERGAQEQQERVARMTLMDFAAATPLPRGPLDLRAFAWQRELYGDVAGTAREQVYQKATQVGVSEQALRWALFHADVMQRVVLYTFPSEDELAEFSRQRIAPVIKASGHLLDRMQPGAVNNVSQKQIGTVGWIYFRGTNKPIDSVNADVVVFDEYDTSDQRSIAESEYRVTGPQSAGLIRRVGVPSIPEFGISKLYDQSDQRVWTIRCEACGEHNPIRGLQAFNDNVCQDTVALVCRKCRRPIDVRAGEWVATYPDRETRGYHIPKLLVPSRRVLSGVIERSRKTADYEKTAWMMRDLGEPYAPAEGRLSLQQVQANVREDLRPVDPWGKVPATHCMRSMGVDVASVRAFNVVIEEAVDELNTIGRKLWVGTIEDDPVRGTAFNQLCWLMDRFKINMCGIDHEPEGRISKALAFRYPGRVYRIGFFSPGPQQRKAPEPMNVDDGGQFVSLWRTRAYDAMFERFRMQHALLPPLELLPSDYAPHLGNLYRRKLEVEQKEPGTGRRVSTGVVKVDYVKTGPEDYAQAEAYNLAAIELYHRNRGLNMALGRGPQPLASIDPTVVAPDPEVDEDDGAWPSGGEPVYRPFE